MNIDEMVKLGEHLKPVLDTFRDELLEEFRKDRFEVARVNLKPGDTVVVQTAGSLSENETRLIREQAQEFFPGHRILILADGLELHILGANAP